MVMILVVYFFLRTSYLKFEKKSIFKLIKDFFTISVLLLLTLYIAGYFEVRIADTLARGFGRDKLNLLSFFDSYNPNYNIPWSIFLPDIQLSIYEEQEGFNYFGIGQIMMLLFALIFFIGKPRA